MVRLKMNSYMYKREVERKSLEVSSVFLMLEGKKLRVTTK